MLRPYTHVFFDVDSTLVTIEGIDELALLKGVGNPVREMTERCMSFDGMNPDIYQKRLELIKPNFSDIKALSKIYLDNLVPDVSRCIHMLNQLGKEIYLISGGIRQALEPLSKFLGIPKSHLFAVDIYFNNHQDYAGFDNKNHLVLPDGKAFIISQLVNKHDNTLFIGDGLSDLVVKPLVNQFIGVTFNTIRTKVMEESNIYIKAKRFNALLPFMINHDEASSLSCDDKTLYDESLINLNDVVLKSVKDI